MNINKFHTIIIITAIMMTLLHCTSEKLPFVDEAADCLNVETTYDLNIKPIIDNSCALVGCHVTGGDAPGVYINYNNLVPFFEDGTFESTVIDQREDPIIGMPPDYSTNGEPKNLAEEELALIKCWIRSGYPEK